MKVGDIIKLKNNRYRSALCRNDIMIIIEINDNYKRIRQIKGRYEHNNGRNWRDSNYHDEDWEVIG